MLKAFHFKLGTHSFICTQTFTICDQGIKKGLEIWPTTDNLAIDCQGMVKNGIHQLKGHQKFSGKQGSVDTLGNWTHHGYDSDHRWESKFADYLNDGDGEIHIT